MNKLNRIGLVDIPLRCPSMFRRGIASVEILFVMSWVRGVGARFY